MLEEIFECPYLLNLINSYLTNKETIKLTYLNSLFKNQRHKLRFNEQWYLWETNLDTWYYDLLTHIVIDFGCISKSSAKICFAKFPKFLIKLEFGYHFNKKLTFIIPGSVTHLIFGHEFNKSIPRNFLKFITHLKLGYYFNQNIQNCIPNSVIHLNFGVFFNQKLKNSIPKYLKSLIVSYDFDQEIEEDDLPDSITHLTFRGNYCRKLKKFPSSLIFLCASETFVENNKEIIPNKVRITYHPR